MVIRADMDAKNKTETQEQKHERDETMENENIERGEAAARQNPQGEGRSEAAAKQNPNGDGVKNAEGGKGLIMHTRTDIGKVYDNVNLQRLYMTMMEGLITAIISAIVDECHKVADGLDNVTREVAKEAMRKERGEA